MNVLNSYAKGIKDALARPKAAAVLWLVNAAFASIVYFVAAGAISSVLARSLASDDLLAKSNVDALFELLTGQGAALNAVLTTILTLIVLYLFVSPFLFGGILHDLVRPRESGTFAQAFWAGGGRFYGRFFRLTVASVILWIPAAVLFILAGKVFDAIGRDPLKEQLNFYLTLARVLAALFLFFLVKMILDYARIRMAATDSRSTLAALVWAASFCMRRLAGTLGLYYLLGLTALAGSAVYLGIQSLFGKTTWGAVLLGFIVTQVHIFWRSWIKVAYQGAELKYGAQGH